MALCQTHCRQVPVFSRLSKNHMLHMSNAHWVVLWLLFFRSAPSMFPPFTGPFLGWESLVFRLHSKIGQIRLSIEAQCDHHTYQPVYNMRNTV